MSTRNIYFDGEKQKLSFDYTKIPSLTATAELYNASLLDFKISNNFLFMSLYMYKRTIKYFII